MANVSIKFNGKEFLLSCENGQEEHLEELSIFLNEKFNNLKDKLGNIGENKLLLITSITVMDEYFETKKKIDQQKNEIKKHIEFAKKCFEHEKKIFAACWGLQVTVTAAGGKCRVIKMLRKTKF